MSRRWSFRRGLRTTLALVIACMTLSAVGASPAAADNPLSGVHPRSLGAYAPTPPSRGALVNDGQSNRYLLGGHWLMRVDPNDRGITAGYWRDTAATTGWAPVTIPNSFNAGNLTKAGYAGGIAWYRRDFTLPAGAFGRYVPRSDRRWVIQFESVNYDATVWLNGHLLGRHGGAYLPFEYTLRDLHAGVNRLVVRVSNALTGSGFARFFTGAGWWNFGGILDAVYLRPVARADIEALRIRTPMRCPTCTATIEEQATIHNLTRRRQTVSLTGRYGRARLNFGRRTIAPGHTWRPSASVTIRHPRLWAPGSPNLYRATLRLADRSGRRLGGYTYMSGIRTITVQHGILRVNGRQVHLRGVDMQEQTATTGAAMSMGAMRRLIGWVRQLGATIIRAHYPLNPELEELADRDGIMLWSEVPIFHPPVSAQADPAWRRRAVALVKRNVEVNQDHPSILLWSIGNEFHPPPVRGQAAYIASAVHAARRLDPTRPVGMALLAVPWAGCAKEYGPLQVIGVNAYFGWFTAGGMYDNREGLGPFMRTVHRCFRNKAIFASEFGFGGNRSGPIEVKGTYQNQAYNAEYSFGVFDGERWLAGAIYQVLQDFASSPGWDGDSPGGTPPIVDKGLLTRSGTPKPAFAVVSALLHATRQIAPAPRRH